MFKPYDIPEQQLRCPISHVYGYAKRSRKAYLVARGDAARTAGRMSPCRSQRHARRGTGAGTPR
eukprot:CAMPEP_0179971466 /NCGR_PEP_ID=MMETSP0983-20121128/36018_1 /TAXON_ID=483367 /ORGANISM="non described non described, Strain CCMP 2436" /LENGTH=63 /DNA_ID=CAMNT_0021886543 /DNA_START=96 /DNA_END=284 /DNA_ORIENTATION=+